MAYYSVRHVTRFQYSDLIRESVMELRMQPRDDGLQRLHSFELTIQPRAQLIHYRDYLGNTIHHFDIPGQHIRLTVTAQAVVELIAPPPLPPALGTGAWRALDGLVQAGEGWEMIQPSQFACATPLLYQLRDELRLARRGDPLTVLRQLNTALHQTFEYAQDQTSVDSPIDQALETRRGVCQDFSHVMIALVRGLGIPCRYISGYLFYNREGDHSAEDATHAWVEALLPELGWVGFDPTNNVLAGERHIRVALGRDYTDIPPTRGIFKGNAQSKLSVAVKVVPAGAPLPGEALAASPEWSAVEPDAEASLEARQQWLQQQQQQQ
jgi:transglutaminase-like putative cysteine protease